MGFLHGFTLLKSPSPINKIVPFLFAVLLIIRIFVALKQQVNQ